MNNTYSNHDGAGLPECPFGIFVDQAGYFPHMKKRAVFTEKHERFTVKSEDGDVRYEGEVREAGFDPLSGDYVYIADFSALTESGTYRVFAGELCSARFAIGEDVYDRVFGDTVKAYYFLRCGCGLEERYAGAYRHAPCHNRPARLWEDREIALDVSGGWHDAGDYGRYVTVGAVACAQLLYAYRLYPNAFHGQKRSIPEDGLPAILSECRYELEWLMKMQRADGAVYHKVTTEGHAPFVMPEEDTAELYLFAPSSMAAADLAAVCALGSEIYREFDGEFSDRLKGAALRSYQWLAKNPDFLGFTNPPECNTGVYGERDDLSNRFWAGAALYALTGERRFHDDLARLLEKDFPRTALGYGEVGGLGALSYLTACHKKERRIAETLKAAFLNEAEYFRETAGRTAYGAALFEWDFHWGSNMPVMQHGMTFLIADYLLGEPRYREYAAAQLHYLLGVNATGYSFVTGSGEFSCNYPHFRPGFADGIDAAIPGMVCGGPNQLPADPVAKRLIPEGTPPMKCYADDVGCYSLNEVTIYWNSPAVFVLAGLLN